MLLQSNSITNQLEDIMGIKILTSLLAICFFSCKSLLLILEFYLFIYLLKLMYFPRFLTFSCANFVSTQEAKSQ